MRRTWDEVRELILRVVFQIPVAKEIVRRAGYFASGTGLPPGGKKGEVVQKLSDEDYDVVWGPGGEYVYDWSKDEMSGVERFPYVRSIPEFRQLNYQDGSFWHMVEPCPVAVATWQGINSAGLYSGAANQGDVGFEFDPYFYPNSSYTRPYGAPPEPPTAQPGYDDPTYTGTGSRRDFPEHWDGNFLHARYQNIFAASGRQARLQAYCTRTSGQGKVTAYLEYPHRVPLVEGVVDVVEVTDELSGFQITRFFDEVFPIEIELSGTGYFDTGWVDLPGPWFRSFEQPGSQAILQDATSAYLFVEDPEENKLGIPFAELTVRLWEPEQWWDWVFNR